MNKPERVFGPQVRCRNLDIFKIKNFLRNCLSIFWLFSRVLGGILLIFLGIFRRIFFGGLFWKDFFGGIFLEGFFWKDFFGENFMEEFFGGFFGRIFLGGIICLHC